MKLQIAFDSIKEFKDFLASVTEKEPEAVSVETVTKAITDKAKATAKPREEAPKEEPKEEAPKEEPKAAEPEKAEPEATEETPKDAELIDVQKAVKKLVKLGQREEAKHILGKFGVTKASELAAKDFNAAFDLLTEAAELTEAANA